MHLQEVTTSVDIHVSMQIHQLARLIACHPSNRTKRDIESKRHSQISGILGGRLVALYSIHTPVHHVLELVGLARPVVQRVVLVVL